MGANLSAHKDFLPASYFFLHEFLSFLSAFRSQTVCGRGVLPPSWKIRNTSKARWFCFGKAAFCISSPCLKDRASIFMVFSSLRKISLPVLPITSKKIHLQLVPTMNSTPVLKPQNYFVQLHIEESLNIFLTKEDSVQIQCPRKSKVEI